jgi:isopenicillin-N epimerase
MPLLAQSDRVKVLTPLNSPDSAAIGFVTIAGLDPARLQTWLLNQHRIVTTLIVHPQFSGLRITPNVYTTPAEIDAFTAQVSTAIRTGLT